MKEGGSGIKEGRRFLQKTKDREDRLNNKFVRRLGMWIAALVLFSLPLSVCSRID